MWPHLERVVVCGADELLALILGEATCIRTLELPANGGLATLTSAEQQQLDHLALLLIICSLRFLIIEKGMNVSEKNAAAQIGSMNIPLHTVPGALVGDATRERTMAESVV